MSQFGRRRPGLVRLPRAVPNLSEAQGIGAIGRTVSQAFGTGAAFAQAERQKTILETQEESAEQQLEIAKERAVTEDVRREDTRTILKNRELQSQFEDMADLEFFGVQELFARGTDEQKRDFLAKHRWADPKNQAKIESFYGRQLATTDWFGAQQKINDFYTNPANEGKSLKVTDVMADFLEDRDDLPPGAAIAYQQQFLGQVGNFIVQQETGRANRRAKDVREQRTRDNIASAGLYFSGNSDLTDYAQVVADNIALIEGEDPDPDTNAKLMIRQMTSSSSEALAKMVGTIPSSELRARIAELPDPVRESSEIKYIETEMVLQDRINASKAITKEADNIKVLTTRFSEANQVRPLRMLEGRINALPEGQQKQQAKTIWQSRVAELETKRNAHLNIMERGANVTIGDISGLPNDLKFGLTQNFQRASRTLREIAEVDRNKAFSLVAEKDERGVAEMMIRAKPQEVNELVGVLNRPGVRDRFPTAIEEKNDFAQSSGILSSLMAATPTDDALDRYGDRYTFHYLDLTTREIDPLSEEAAKKAAGQMVKAELETDFMRAGFIGGVAVYGRSELFRVGNVGKPDKNGTRRLNAALADLSFASKRQGDVTPNVGLSFGHKGLTYVPSTGNGRAGVFLEWDPPKQDWRLISPQDNITLFRELERKLSTTANEADLVSNSDVRWRESYGTRFVSEFDAAFFTEQPDQDLGTWISEEAERRWFAQEGELPRLVTEGLEGRALDLAQREQRVFNQFMNQIALELGWSGLDNTMTPGRVADQLAVAPPVRMEGASDVEFLKAQAKVMNQLEDALVKRREGREALTRVEP